MRIHRLLDRPIISADLHPSIGANIQGPFYLLYAVAGESGIAIAEFWP